DEFDARFYVRRRAPRHRQRMGSPGPAIGYVDGQVLPTLARPRSDVGGGGAARRATRDVARQGFLSALLLGRLNAEGGMEIKNDNRQSLLRIIRRPRQKQNRFARR